MRGNGRETEQDLASDEGVHRLRRAGDNGADDAQQVGAEQEVAPAKAIRQPPEYQHADCLPDVPHGREQTRVLARADVRVDARYRGRRRDEGQVRPDQRNANADEAADDASAVIVARRQLVGSWRRGPPRAACRHHPG